MSHVSVKHDSLEISIDGGRTICFGKLSDRANECLFTRVDGRVLPLAYFRGKTEANFFFRVMSEIIMSPSRAKGKIFDR